jgi:hypothetical protein
VSGLAFGGVLSVALYLLSSSMLPAGKAFPKVNTTFMDEWFDPCAGPRSYSACNLGVLSPFVWRVRLR